MLPIAIFVCFGWILCVCIHEFGHAVVAYWGGDTSVKDKGYLTLNPLKYTNLNLSLILPLLFLLMGGIALPGAAVYINQARLRNRWWQSAVSAAGPIASGIVTLLLAIPFQLSLALLHTQYWWLCPALACLIFLQIYVTIINSLPIPSLDGYGVIEPWLPRKLQKRLAKYSASGFIFLFMLLWFVKPLNLFFSNSSTVIAQILGVPSIAIAAGFASFNKSSSILLIAVIGFALLIHRITKKPNEIWFERGNTFSKSGQYEQAIAAYDKAIQIQPELVTVWLRRGEALFNLKRYEEAIASYDNAIQIKLDSDEVWYYRGLALHYSNRYEEAVASYNKAIQLKDENYLAWHFRSLTLYVLQRYEEALAGYDKVIQIQPAFAQAWDHRGCVLTDLERYEEAIASCNKAIQIQPYEPGAWTDKGIALAELQRYEEALANYNKAIQIKPKLYSAWLDRGVTLQKLQRYKEAFASYKRVIKIETHNSFDLFVLGYALCKLQRYEEAIATCDEAIQSDPKYALAWYCKACCYLEQNNLDLFTENLKQAIKLAPRQVKRLAKTDSSFDSIRENQLFKQLIGE